jgi:hypothetical protein
MDFPLTKFKEASVEDLLKFHRIVKCMPIAWQRLGKQIPAEADVQ